MKASTLKNRLEKRFTGSKSSIAYKNVMKIITDKSYTFIRPCYTSGKGRFTTNMDYTSDICGLLDLLGVKYESGNDSPRGGKTGNFIKIITKINYEK